MVPVGPLDVIVPHGRDEHMDFSDGVPPPSPLYHPPVSFHGMAAATAGMFHCDPSTVVSDSRAVLVLIPNRFWRAVETAELLSSRGHPILASWKECGRHQLHAAWKQKGYETAMHRMRRTASAWVASSPAGMELLGSRMRGVRVIELPTPYPVELPDWQFTLPENRKREGLFIGTREWRVPSRRHRNALRIASRLAKDDPGLTVTVVNPDGILGKLRILLLSGRTATPVPPMKYGDYLKCMAGQRLVLQRDRSGVPGQVAGDALLAGIPCLGGDGMIDRIAFPHLPGAGAKDEEVLESARRLLTDDSAWSAAVEGARGMAEHHVSFQAFRRSWSKVLRSLV